MEQELLARIADHLANKATLPSVSYYITLAHNGTEVSGIARQLVTYDDPVEVDPNHYTMTNNVAVDIDPPDGLADEGWVMTAASGGELWFRIPFPSEVTLTSGVTKTFAPGDITHHFQNTTSAAP